MDKRIIGFVVVEVGFDQFAIRTIQRYFVGLFTFIGGNVSINKAPPYNGAHPLLPLMLRIIERLVPAT